MCGRTCMSLDPEEIVCACKYKLKNSNQFLEPTFRNEYNLGKKYIPSYNLAPTDICPILISSKHLDDSLDSANRTIVPASFSIIPKWHKGDYKKHGLTSNNARIEGLQHSKLYKPLLDRGKRCVMVIEGFYEWKTTAPNFKTSERPVYFIHMPQDQNIKIEDKSTWTCHNLKLLHLAGLFDIWTDERGDSIFNFTILTLESDKYFGWLHHRSPAVLEEESQIRDWLDYDRVPQEEAMKLIKLSRTIVWHQVSNYVNSTKNQSEQCKKSIAGADKSTSSILKWLKKRKEGDDDVDKETSSSTMSNERSPKRKKLR